MADGGSTLSIGEVAARTGLTIHALRFYERERILAHPVSRGPQGHRRYSEHDVEWLTICLSLRTSGMPLAAIRRYAQLVRDGPGNEQDRLALLRRHEQAITEQIGELQNCLDLISYKVGLYEDQLARGAAAQLWNPPAP